MSMRNARRLLCLLGAFALGGCGGGADASGFICDNGAGGVDKAWCDNLGTTNKCQTATFATQQREVCPPPSPASTVGCCTYAHCDKDPPDPTGPDAGFANPTCR